MTSMTRLYLIRHGQVQGFEQRRYNGHADVALTDLGVEQYHLLKDRLADSHISACYSSDLTRCKIGANIICEQFGIEPVHRSELRELNIGIWESLTWQEIQSRWPNEWQARLNDLVNYRVPEGENLLDVEARAMPVVREMLERHRGQELLLVGHGGLNRIILLNAIGAPLINMFNIEQNYGCLNIIDYYADGRATVKLLNG
ncbi:alpha-ribazole phosphatase [Trichlorobacter lovleyi]|uniref:Alpha-ribazole phosphatase n=1 Tax=Trichlorobacter lovleyi (strain ATCC BAA-1151 / DSM 17278 / SZ) TaxID=398767 RepID=B3E977_TRIL1|nr:alpha-ribazole phosphatase [Trichlorobacter lovleyi]ACD96790.1 alpha-ribazole phosphatase [Trichlorobacter lovleyi SZ]QOX80065.1 alpha-ribazole phosphatase [Trichlorobacter lovleyi]